MRAAFLMLHYGAPYLEASLAAMYPQVDKIAIAYTDKPSQSFSTNKDCPDKEEDLLKLTLPFKDKIIWQKGSWEHEHQHCDAARDMVKEYEWRVRFDSDEIFSADSVDAYIKQAELTTYKEFRMPFLHFWRCFHKVCRDGSNPFRLERNTGDGSGWLDSANETLSVYHMGYAMPTEYIRYKMDVQGHHSEWRPDWFQDRWMANAQFDVHPVIFRPPFWNTEDFAKEKLPVQLKKHLYYDKDLID